ncbi:MAG: MFS transporter, partial [Alphaproteobacteria bacterium]|nr:MFS transporter [Alphaproteobacteria bacterium]
MTAVAAERAPSGARVALSTGFAHAVHDGITSATYLLLPLVQAPLGLALVEVGVLRSLQSGALAIFQLPSSLLGERMGARRLLVLGTAAMGLTYALLALAPGFWSLALLLFLTGLASSVQHPLSATLVTQSAGAAHRTAMGVYNFGGDVGKVALPALFGLAAGLYDWRLGVAVCGLVALASAMVLRWTVPETHAAGGKRETADKVPLWAPLKSRGYAALASLAMIDSGTRAAFMVFLPFHLSAKGADVELIGLALALIFGGGAAGKLVCGWLADRIGMIPTAVATEIGTAVMILLTVPMEPVAVLPLLPLLGVMLNGTSS